MERRIVLPKGDYYELRARLRDADVLEIQAKHERLKAIAVFEALAKAHGFDPRLEYRFEDATCELIGDDTSDVSRGKDRA